MKYLLLISTTLLAFAQCNLESNESSANLNQGFQKTFVSNQEDATDTLLPKQSVGIRALIPMKDFENRTTFEEFLQYFPTTNLPYELTEATIDRTDEAWKKEPKLSTAFFPQTLDASDYEFARNVANPKENLEAFFNVHPIAKFKENDWCQSVVLAIRYLDGNGQQDFFYLINYTEAGKLISSLEIGAFVASSESYLKTAVVRPNHFVVVTQAEFDEGSRLWQPVEATTYYMDNVGQAFLKQTTALEEGKKTKDSGEGFAFGNLSEFEQFFLKFQQAVRRNNPSEVAQLITFPHFRVSLEEHYEDIQNEAEFLQKYPLIFDDELRKKILKQALKDLKTNEDGIGLKDESVWFKRIGVDGKGRLAIGVLVQ